MALLHKSSWLQDKKPTQLGPGYHYDQSVRSIVVPEGQQVTFYENQDRQGFKSKIFYEGEYADISWYGIHQKPGVVHIEQTGLRSNDMIQVENGVSWTDDKGKHWFIMIWKIPVGQRKKGDDFPDNVIDRIRIPFGVTVEVFDKENLEGGSLIFSGNDVDGDTIINLPDYDYHDKISSMIVSSDDWEPAGIELRNERITEGDSKKRGGTGTIANNSDEGVATLTKEIEVTREKSTTTEWSIEGGVSVSSGFEAGYDNGVVAKATGEIEISFSAGYGESESKTEISRTMDSVTAEVPPMSTRKISIYVEYGKMEADAIRKLRNRRTGMIIEQTGKITIDYASKTEAEIH